MTRAYTPALLLLLAGIAGLAAFATAQDEPATITWRQDLEAARADAADKGRPLMVVFR